MVFKTKKPKIFSLFNEILRIQFSFPSSAFDPDPCPPLNAFSVMGSKRTKVANLKEKRS